MIGEQTSQATRNQILKAFKEAHMPLCITDFSKLSVTKGINKSTLRYHFEALEKDAKIIKIPDVEAFSRRESYYILNSSNTTEVEMEIVSVINYENKGITIREYQTKLSSQEIQIIAGIKPLRAQGIQRMKESAWVKQIAEGITNSPYPLFFNSVLIYVNEKKIKDFNDKKIRLITRRYQSDFEKPGWLVDGQQRNWALHQLHLEHTLDEPIELIGIHGLENLRLPVILIVANFEPNSEEEKAFLRFTFQIANSSKNLPKTFIGEILASLSEDFAITDKDIINRFLSTIRREIDSNSDSPLNGLIILESKASIEGAFIKGSVIYNVIRAIWEAYKTAPKSISLNKELFSGLMIEFLRIVKEVFPDDWEASINSKGKDNWLLTRLGLGSLALLIPQILPIVNLQSPTREEMLRAHLSNLEGFSWDRDALEEEGYRKAAADTTRLMENELQQYILL